MDYFAYSPTRDEHDELFFEDDVVVVLKSASVALTRFLPNLDGAKPAALDHLPDDVWVNISRSLSPHVKMMRLPYSVVVIAVVNVPIMAFLLDSCLARLVGDFTAASAFLLVSFISIIFLIIWFLQYIMLPNRVILDRMKEICEQDLDRLVESNDYYLAIRRSGLDYFLRFRPMLSAVGVPKPQSVHNRVPSWSLLLEALALCFSWFVPQVLLDLLMK